MESLDFGGNFLHREQVNRKRIVGHVYGTLVYEYTEQRVPQPIDADGRPITEPEAVSAPEGL